jgi:hypothetical protein
MWSTSSDNTLVLRFALLILVPTYFGGCEIVEMVVGSAIPLEELEPPSQPSMLSSEQHRSEADRGSGSDGEPGGGRAGEWGEMLLAGGAW